MAWIGYAPMIRDLIYSIIAYSSYLSLRDFQALVHILAILLGVVFGLAW
jgi:hypothetical protein